MFVIIVTLATIIATVLNLEGMIQGTGTDLYGLLKVVGIILLGGLLLFNERMLLEFFRAMAKSVALCIRAAYDWLRTNH